MNREIRNSFNLHRLLTLGVGSDGLRDTMKEAESCLKKKTSIESAMADFIKVINEKT